jgi:drug/metabolite transporter (DMT)-like permease
VIAAGDFQAGGGALLGDAMALGAAVTFAGYLVIGRHVRQGLGVAVYAGTVYGVGGLLIAGLAVLLGHSMLDFSQRDLLVWLALILIPTLAGHTVFNWALKHLQASVVGVAILGEPVLTIMWAWLLLDEVPPPTAFIGGAVILVGLYIALRPAAAEPSAASRNTPAQGG